MEFLWIWFCVCLTTVMTVVSGTPVQTDDSMSAHRVSGKLRQGVNQEPTIIDNLALASSTDQKSAETGYGHGHGHGHGHGFDSGLGHGGHGHGKYFQYAHNPDYGHYEFGYRRGNDYHFQERYEKAHDWKFKTKVKWGDKYGGYGEHYWDYNHADKSYGGDHGGSGHDDGHGHGHGHYSEQVPVVSEPEATHRNNNDRGKKKRESKRHGVGGSTSAAGAALNLDTVSGKVTDERTGRTYWLQPTQN